MTAAAVMRAVALAAALAAAACGTTEEPAGATQEAPAPTEFSPKPPAVTASPGEEGDTSRYQRLSVEALQLMIEAARRELPIGPFQDRISAARRAVPTDFAAAADQLEEVVADLRAMLEVSRK